MRKYFDDIDAIHQFTMELNYHHSKIKCENCLKSDQFLSHGFVYKKQNCGEKKVIGKRLYCSNRYGKSGCGKTVGLYLATHIPTLQYTTSHLFIFIASLLSKFSIQKAYKVATNSDDPRNAYRWLHRLWKKLIDYRCFVQNHMESQSDKLTSRPLRLQLLLPTLQVLFSKVGEPPCSQFQKITQTSFI
jgi:hypothetical protein